MRNATPIALSLVTALALFGCSSEDELIDEPEVEAPASTPEPGSSSTLDGTYRLVTHLDLGSGQLGSDELQDLLTGLQEAPLETLIMAGADKLGAAAAATLEDWLQKKIDPDFLAKVGDIAAIVDEALGDVEVVTELSVTAGAATHAVVGATLTIDGKAYEITVDGTASAVDVVLDGAKLSLSDHDLGLPLGSAISEVIDGKIIELLDDSATSVGDALASLVDCGKLANGDTFVQIACEFGADKLSKELEDAIGKLSKIEAKVGLSGAATVGDGNGDGVIDNLDGSWSIDESDVPFLGARM